MQIDGRRDEDRPFEAWVRRWWIDDLALVDCDCGPCSGTRQRRQMGDTDGDGKGKIRVNGICPTYATTSLTRELFDDKDFDQVFTESIPLKRWGEVDDIASLAVFLASDDSSYIHGDLIKVDGGETLCRYSV